MIRFFDEHGFPVREIASEYTWNAGVQPGRRSLPALHQSKGQVTYALVESWRDECVECVGAECGRQSPTSWQALCQAVAMAELPSSITRREQRLQCISLDNRQLTREKLPPGPQRRTWTLSSFGPLTTRSGCSHWIQVRSAGRRRLQSAAGRRGTSSC